MFGPRPRRHPVSVSGRWAAPWRSGSSQGTACSCTTTHAWTPSTPPPVARSRTRRLGRAAPERPPGALVEASVWAQGPPGRAAPGRAARPRRNPLAAIKAVRTLPMTLCRSSHAVPHARRSPVGCGLVFRCATRTCAHGVSRACTPVDDVLPIAPLAPPGHGARVGGAEPVGRRRPAATPGARARRRREAGRRTTTRMLDPVDLEPRLPTGAARAGRGSQADARRLGVRPGPRIFGPSGARRQVVRLRRRRVVIALLAFSVLGLLGR